ncbi:unnamed protein product [Effrenium voratum]|nr:unnamed protein product [Effrenium voratum]
MILWQEEVSSGHGACRRESSLAGAVCSQNLHSIHASTVSIPVLACSKFESIFLPRLTFVIGKFGNSFTSLRRHFVFARIQTNLRGMCICKLGGDPRLCQPAVSGSQGFGCSAHAWRTLAMSPPDVLIPEYNDKALFLLLSSLDGDAPSSLPPGWDKVSAFQRLSAHLQLIDSEITRKLKGLEDLNSHLAALSGQDPKPAAASAGRCAPCEAELTARGCSAGSQTQTQTGPPSDAYTPRVAMAPTGTPTAQAQRSWAASPTPTLQRLASAPAGWKGARVYQMTGTASAGHVGVMAPRAVSPYTARAGSVGPQGPRHPAPVLMQSVQGICPTPGSPRVVLTMRGSSPDSRTRCASPVAGLHQMPPTYTRPPRAAASPVPAVSQSWHPHRPPPQVSSRFVLVSTYGQEAPRMERCATPRRVPSRPPAAGASPGRPAYLQRVHTPRT